MKDDIESNVYLLVYGLQSIIDAEYAIPPADLLARLNEVVELLPKNIDDTHPSWRVYAGVVRALDIANTELKDGSISEGISLLVAARDRLRALLPRFRLVLLNETPYWTDKELVKECGQIWTAYLYDEQRKFHAADIRPSYELHFLYRTPENFVSDATHERLNNEGDDTNLTYYCKVIDDIEWDRKHFCGRPQEAAADNYDALVESEIEHYRSNHVFDLPRPPTRQMLIASSKEQCEAGEYAAAMVTIQSATSSLEAEIHALVDRLKSGNVGSDIADAYANLEAMVAAEQSTQAAERPQG